ncbi:MAG: thermonuclease family protein [Hyphomicrobiaceae bacterium]
MSGYATKGLVRLAFAGVLAVGLWIVSLAIGVESRAGLEDALGPTLPPPSGPAIVGYARVVDGDTIEVAGRRIRLEGIDAPETSQTCPRRWSAGWGWNRDWDAGHAATRHIAKLVEGREVHCMPLGTDRYRRTLGVCSVDGHEINADLVRQGLAWAFVKYSLRYVDVEKEARAARRGIWQAPCQPAWDYRANRWSAEASGAPEGCAIKGNISRNGRIYHMPWSVWYAKTRIEPARGERWFCSEAEALAAGWKPARTGAR